MRITRRGLLVGGGVGLVGLQAFAEPPPVRLIVVVANGGWDPTFSIDPKPGKVDGPYPDLDPDDPDDVEVIAEYGDVRVTLNERRRSGVSRFFEDHGHRVAVVNGLWVGSMSHWQAMVRVLTGRTTEDAPDMATIAGVELGADRPLASVDLSGVSRMGPYAPMCARTGVRGQLSALLDPVSRPQLDEGVHRPKFRPDEPDRDAIDAWLTARSEGDRVDPARASWYTDRREARARAERLRRLDGLAATLPTDRRNGVDDDMELAVQLLRKGTCHSVVLDTEQRWDTHSRSVEQNGSTHQTFRSLGTLADRLVEEGMIDHTLVAVVSEMGRSPFRNADQGTEHWPYTSALLFGADVAGGRKVGGTDDDLVGVPGADGGPVRYDQLTAGILEAVGVDPAPWLKGVAPLRGFRV